MSSFNSGGVADDIAEAFFADAFEPEGPPVVARAEPARPDYDPASFEPETFDAFAGRYELTGAPGVVVRFRRDGGRYLVQVIGQSEEEIVPVGPSRFSTPDGEAEISFNASPDGSVETITLHQDGDQQATRVPSEPETVVLADYVGRYYSDEVGTVYTVRVEDGGFVLAHSRMHTPIRLRHSAGGVFVGRYLVTSLSFERDVNGPATGFAAESVRTRGVRFDRMD